MMKRRESGVAKKFSVGEQVAVACSIQQGPFPDEKLVTVETEDGEISGFVKIANLQTAADGEHGFVNGIVVAVEQDSIRVQISGSFFTTAAGIALIAKHQLSRLSAA
jgi:hypothetical protein